MLKLLIVEDERWEREGLIDFLEWNELGIDIVGAACDGIEGYEMALTLEPDIVITDIRMPGMDGLEMSRKLKAFRPEMKLIILTGYSDFDYVREALKLQASEYVLKPVEELELLRSIGKVLDECEQERKAIREQAELLAEVRDHRRIVMAKQAMDLLEGRLSEHEVRELGDMAGFASVKGRFLVMSFLSGEDWTENTMEEVLERPHIKAFTSYGTGVWFVVMNTEGVEPAVVASQCHDRLKETFAADPSAFFLISMGTEVPALMNISTTYREAREALELGWFREIAGIVGPEHLERKKLAYAHGIGDFMHRFSKLEKQLAYSVNALDEASAAAILHELFDQFEQSLFADREFVLRLMTSLFHELELMSGAIEHRKPEDIGVEQSLQGMMTLREVQVYSTNYLQQIVSWMSAKRGGKDEYIIRKVNRIIETRYASNDISLTSVADEVFLSPNYLGAMYKKSTGRTFLEVLTEYRMDKAKELLALSGYKVARVAAEVGIPNSSYFGMVFKNRFGLMPGEYQEMIHRK